MIKEFGDKPTEDLFNGISSTYARRIPNKIWDVAQRKLDLLNAAQSLDDIKSPPGNRLEKLKGDYRGFYSIRINDQWRVVFKWDDRSSSAYEVRVIDYH